MAQNPPCSAVASANVASTIHSRQLAAVWLLEVHLIAPGFCSDCRTCSVRQRKLLWQPCDISCYGVGLSIVCRGRGRVTIPPRVTSYSRDNGCETTDTFSNETYKLYVLHASYTNFVLPFVSYYESLLVLKYTQCQLTCIQCLPMASARAWNSLPSSVRNAPSLTTFRRELKTTFPVVVWQWLGDRDCTAQYNCCLPATTDCQRFCCFCLLSF